MHAMRPRQERHGDGQFEGARGCGSETRRLTPVVRFSLDLEKVD